MEGLWKGNGRVWKGDGLKEERVSTTNSLTETFYIMITNNKKKRFGKICAKYINDFKC